LKSKGILFIPFKTVYSFFHTLHEFFFSHLRISRAENNVAREFVAFAAGFIAILRNTAVINSAFLAFGAMEDFAA
jgi:hypothetical protein